MALYTEKSCVHPGCTRRVRARGYCKAHYSRLLGGRDMDAPIRDRKARPYKTCTVSGCARPHDSHGFCGGHLYRHRNGSDLNAPWKGEIQECKAPNCDRAVKALGLCAGHYSRQKSGKPIDTPLRNIYEGERTGCLVPGCDKPYAAMGLCRRHTNQRMTYGISLEKIIELSQENCSICGSADDLNIDHDHSCCPSGSKDPCGECVRGVLCNSCNFGLGVFKDSPELMEQAIAYLRSH